jgi:hypothetical protein
VDEEQLQNFEQIDDSSVPCKPTNELAHRVERCTTPSAQKNIRTKNAVIISQA